MGNKGLIRGEPTTTRQEKRLPDGSVNVHSLPKNQKTSPTRVFYKE